MKKAGVQYEPSKANFDTTRMNHKLMLALESTILQNVTNLETSLGYFDAAIPGESHTTEIYDALGGIKALLESLSVKAAKAMSSNNGRMNTSGSGASSGSINVLGGHHPKVAQRHALQRKTRWDNVFKKEPTAKATVKRNIDNLSKVANRVMMSSSFDAMKTPIEGTHSVDRVSLTSSPNVDADSKSEVSHMSGSSSVGSATKVGGTGTETGSSTLIIPEMNQNQQHQAPEAARSPRKPKVEKTITKTSSDTGDLEAKLASIDLKRKELEKRTSTKRLNRATDPSSGSSSGSTTTTNSHRAIVPPFGATVPGSGSEIISPVPSLQAEADTTLLHRDLEDDIPAWGSGQKSSGGHLSPRDGDGSSDSRHGHSLSRTSSTGDGDRDSAVESPIPALFMAGAGGEAVEFDASMDPSRLWITGQDWHKQPVASPPSVGGSADKRKTSGKSTRRPAPPPPIKLNSNSYYRSPGGNTNNHGERKKAPSSGDSGSAKKAKFSNHTGSGYEAI